MVISEAFWSRRFARDPRAIGQSLTFGGQASSAGSQSYQIVGVMPRSFASGTVDVWLAAQTPPAILQMRNARFFSGVGRLKPGVSSIRLARTSTACRVHWV